MSSLRHHEPSNDREAATNGGYVASKWSPELIVSLDWKRITEIARAMASTAGFELAATQLQTDGRADFEMTARGLDPKHRARVRLTPWDQWTASGDSIRDFAQTMKEASVKHGIYIAPGGFSPAAQNAASAAGIEVVDALALALQLNALPPAHSDFFFEIGTAGAASVPSCPVCLSQLKLMPDTVASHDETHGPPDISYRTSDIIADAVVARRVEIVRDCEVQFLREVRARDVIVHGVAAGDFICEGAMLLNPGAVLTGTVAARSVLVRPGAELHGETRILDGPLPNLHPTAPVIVWRCSNPCGLDKCKTVRFVPH